MNADRVILTSKSIQSFQTNAVEPALIANAGDAGSDPDYLTLLGAKAFNLARLTQAGFKVPSWFVLTPLAFFKSLPQAQQETFLNADASQRMNMVIDLTMDRSIESQVESTIRALSWAGRKLAVRSSSPDEDGSKLSFAGQFASFLNVESTEVPRAVERVWRSGFTKQVTAYRWLNGLAEPAQPPAVIVQEMVHARLAGVAFGANPLTGDTNEVTISAVTGYGDKLVSGEVNSANYILRGQVVERRVNESLGRLSTERLFEIQEALRSAQDLFGAPQDIEWAIDDRGVLFILQSRPITALGATFNATSPCDLSNVTSPGDSSDATSSGVSSNATPSGGSSSATSPGGSSSTYPGGGSSAVPAGVQPDATLAGELKLKERLDIFDNSNIGESYPGITTPLTFSFARKAYQHVYEQFCRLMGVSDDTIMRHSHIFPQMLGMVRGRIYYNLLNWYRLLSLFPGFRMNRSFMEQMMGVKAELPPEFLDEFNSSLSVKEKIADTISVCRLVPKLICKWLQLPGDIVNFNRRVERSLSRVPRNGGSSLGQLANLYRQLEQDLLLNWDAPIVNDFFAMVFFGLLRALCGKWLKDQPGIHNQLLCGETGIVSTEPVRCLQELAELARRDQRIIAILQKTDRKSTDEELSQYQEFYEAYRSHLDKFGDRCVGELKLESPTVKDNPACFLNAVANLAENARASSGSSSSPETNNTDQVESNAKSARLIAEQIVRKKFEKQPWHLRAFQWSIFNLVLWQARTRIRERENLRFLRTRVFGAVRLIFVEMARQLQERGLLRSQDDVFYLETEEIVRFIEGTSTSRDLQSIADSRKREFHQYRSMPAPPDRFMIKGGVNLCQGPDNLDSQVPQRRQESGLLASVPHMTTREGTLLVGLGCCPGVVAGPARVIDDPNIEQLKEGELLVAKRTDPGWITVIAQAKGIVVEHGSLLSHTAIVARELGIPTVVSVENVTREIKTGDWIEIDGARGAVRVQSEKVEMLPLSTSAPNTIPGPQTPQVVRNRTAA